MPFSISLDEQPTQQPLPRNPGIGCGLLLMGSMAGHLAAERQKQLTSSTNPTSAWILQSLPPDVSICSFLIWSILQLDPALCRSVMTNFCSSYSLSLRHGIFLGNTGEVAISDPRESSLIRIELCSWISKLGISSLHTTWEAQFDLEMPKVKTISHSFT